MVQTLQKKAFQSHFSFRKQNENIYAFYLPDKHFSFELLRKKKPLLQKRQLKTRYYKTSPFNIGKLIHHHSYFEKSGSTIRILSRMHHFSRTAVTSLNMSFSDLIFLAIYIIYNIYMYEYIDTYAVYICIKL